MAKVLITNSYDKNNLIKKIRQEKPFAEVKFYSLNELEKIYPYIYTPETLEYICQKENVILDVAKIYLSTICSAPIENLSNEKGIFLTNLKQDLLTKKLLIFNNGLKKYLSNNEIVLENIYPSKKLQKIFANLPNVTYLFAQNQEKTIPKVFVCNNIEEEITFVGEQIIELIHNNININHIYLKNVTDEYIYPLKRIFKLLNIPLLLNQRTTLIELPLVATFLKLYQENEQTAYDYLEEKQKEAKNSEIITIIINLLNKYANLKNKILFITNDLKTLKKPLENKQNCIRELDLKQQTTKDDYVFFLDFNSNIPHSFKDEDYLNDEEKERLGLDTAEDLNKIEKETIKNIITTTPNCFITFKKENRGKECYPSDLLTNFPQENASIKLNSSHNYNQVYLASLLDEYVKYNTTSQTLFVLKNTYSIPYQTYDEQFDSINKENLYAYLKNKLTLSYTALDTFNKCSFSYYLNNILHLKPSEENFNLKIGTLFHKVLERMHEEEFSFDYVYDYEAKKETWTHQEQFFLTKLKDDFRFVIQTILAQEKYSSLKTIKTEVPVEFKIPSKLDVTFKGKIDKLSSTKVDNQTVINITDYKTGDTTVNPAYYPIGLNLQLPTYLYLIKKINNLENIIIGGFYLQKILLPKIKYDPNKNYETQKKELVKLQGYSNPNKEILKLVDNEYQNSSLIYGLKEKKDGNFAHTSRLLDEETTTKMYEIIDANIKNCLTNIENANFLINPKIVDNKDNVSCSYCPFKDICFHTAKDNVYVNSVKNFLRKEVQDGLND